MGRFVLGNFREQATLDDQARLRELYWPLLGGKGASLGRPARIGLVIRGAPLRLDGDGAVESELFTLDFIAHQLWRAPSKSMR